MPRDMPNDQATAAPENIGAEQAVLGALLVNNDVLLKITALRAEHFYDPVHARIFEIAKARIDKGQMATPVTIKGLMDGDPGLAELGGPAYLARLAAASITIGATPEYAQVIMDAWVRRRVLQVSEEMVEWSQQGERTVEEIAATVEQQFLDLREVTSAKPLSASFFRASMDAIAELTQIYQSGGGGTMTGLASFDSIIGGLRGGRLYLMGGRPGMGKTSVALGLACGITNGQDHDGNQNGVIFTTLEMSKTELMYRFYSLKLRERGRKVPFFIIEQGKLNETDFRDVLQVTKENARMPIRFVDPPNLELTTIVSGIRSAAKGGFTGNTRPAAIIIDYLQLIAIRGEKDRFALPGRVTKALKALARELDLPIILLSQLSRGVEQRGIQDRRPVMADLRNSGEIEEDAHAIIFCYRHAYYLEKQIKATQDETERDILETELAACQNRIELIVEKNRSGPLGTARLHIELPYNLIRDIPGQEDML